MGAGRRRLAAHPKTFRVQSGAGRRADGAARVRLARARRYTANADDRVPERAITGLWTVAFRQRTVVLHLLLV